MDDISLHILDIAENSISAGAKRLEIKIEEDTNNDVLTIEITDNGKGMDSKTLNGVTDPFVTTRTTRRVGLGIPMLKEAAEAANGGFFIESKPGKGTKVRVFFQYSNIDRKPIGNMSDTLISIIMMSESEQSQLTDENRTVCYYHKKNGREFYFNTDEIKKQLGLNKLSSVLVLNELKKIIENKIKKLNYG